MSLARILMMALAILVAQVLVSSLWLARFAQGPAERVWRRFTYAQRA